jgi:hypothetical protein
MNFDLALNLCRHCWDAIAPQLSWLLEGDRSATVASAGRYLRNYAPVSKQRHEE